MCLHTLEIDTVALPTSADASNNHVQRRSTDARNEGTILYPSWNLRTTDSKCRNEVLKMGISIRPEVYVILEAGAVASKHDFLKFTDTKPP